MTDLGPAPLVSVIIPSYGRRAWLQEAIESVLAQTYRPLELVVADCPYPDGTRELLTEYASEHAEIRLIALPDNPGPIRARNEALAAIRGPLIAWLDSDDVWLPQKLELQIEALLEDPRCGLVYTDWEDCNAIGETIPRTWPVDYPQGDALADVFMEGIYPCTSSIVFRREALARSGGVLREFEFSFGDDHYVWLTAAADWRVAYVDEVLVRSRVHDSNESSRRPHKNFFAERINLLHDFMQANPDTKARLGPSRRRTFAAQHTLAGKFELMQRRPLGAIPHWAKAIAWHPGVVAQRAAGELRRVTAKVSKRGRSHRGS